VNTLYWVFFAAFIVFNGVRFLRKWNRATGPDLPDWKKLYEDPLKPRLNAESKTPQPQAGAFHS
jgi:hypothetical protein